MVNKKRLIKLTRHLIGINSENPPGGEEALPAGFRDKSKNIRV
jgi:hypothetical protein